MTTAIKSAIATFAQPKAEPNANSIHFFDEDLAPVAASGIPEDFRKLSRFLPVIVLVPKRLFMTRRRRKSRDPISPSLASSMPAVSLRWMQRRPGWRIPTPQTCLSLAESKDVFNDGNSSQRSARYSHK